MWPFSSNTTLAKSGVLQGATEWHCHILPGVDDGVKTLRESLRILADYEEAGITTVWFTPHIMEDVPNTPAALRERFAELCDAYKGNISLNLAAENMMDSLFEERLEARDILPIGSEGNHLLVETSYYTPPYDLDGILSRVMAAGYHPLLAHPERYRYMDLDWYDRLHDMGIKMQLNLTSLAGLYGPEARKRAIHLLKKGYYSASGFDLHRHRTFPHTIQASVPKKVISLLPSGIES